MLANANFARLRLETRFVAKAARISPCYLVDKPVARVVTRLRILRARVPQTNYESCSRHGALAEGGWLSVSPQARNLR